MPDLLLLRKPCVTDKHDGNSRYEPIDRRPAFLTRNHLYCAAAKQEEQNVAEPLPEQLRTLLVIRAPLSADGFVSLYFSSTAERLMTDQEWFQLKQLVELTNKVCIREQARSATA